MFTQRRSGAMVPALGKLLYEFSSVSCVSLGFQSELRGSFSKRGADQEVI